MHSSRFIWNQLFRFVLFFFAFTYGQYMKHFLYESLAQTRTKYGRPCQYGMWRSFFEHPKDEKRAAAQLGRGQYQTVEHRNKAQRVIVRCLDSSSCVSAHNLMSYAAKTSFTLAGLGFNCKKWLRCKGFLMGRTLFVRHLYMSHIYEPKILIISGLFCRGAFSTT